MAGSIRGVAAMLFLAAPRERQECPRLRFCGPFLPDDRSLRGNRCRARRECRRRFLMALQADARRPARARPRLRPARRRSTLSSFCSTAGRPPALFRFRSSARLTTVRAGQFLDLESRAGGRPSCSSWSLCLTLVVSGDCSALEGERVPDSVGT